MGNLPSSKSKKYNSNSQKYSTNPNLIKKEEDEVPIVETLYEANIRKQTELFGPWFQKELNCDFENVYLDAILSFEKHRFDPYWKYREYYRLMQFHREIKIPSDFSEDDVVEWIRNHHYKKYSDLQWMHIRHWTLHSLNTYSLDFCVEKQYCERYEQSIQELMNTRFVSYLETELKPKALKEMLNTHSLVTVQDLSEFQKQHNILWIWPRYLVPIVRQWCVQNKENYHFQLQIKHGCELHWEIIGGLFETEILEYNNRKFTKWLLDFPVNLSFDNVLKEKTIKLHFQPMESTQELELERWVRSGVYRRLNKGWEWVQLKIHMANSTITIQIFPEFLKAYEQQFIDIINTHMPKFLATNVEKVLDYMQTNATNHYRSDLVEFCKKHNLDGITHKQVIQPFQIFNHQNKTLNVKLDLVSQCIVWSLKKI